MDLSKSHEPQLLRQLRQKTLTLQLSIDKKTQTKRNSLKILDNLQKQYSKLEQQKQVQYRKNKSMLVLLNELEQMYYQNYLENKLTYLPNDDCQSQQNNSKSMENMFLRHLLVKQTQNNKQLVKVLNFLKQLQLDKNKNKAKEFIKKSNFLESQSEVMAKLRSQLANFRNQNLQCSHKWYDLQQQIRKLEHNEKLYKIQLQRQKTQLKQQYENYLDRMNQAKMKLVSFNETQRQSIITDYFVKQIAVLQQKRVQIQQQNGNLAHHYQTLQQQLNRIKLQNKQLHSFFINDGEQCALARKMKTRIEQLRDVLIQLHKKNKDTRSVKLNKIVENLRKQLNNLCQANDLMQLRVRDQQDYGIFLDEKPIAQFFQKILQQKDKQLQAMKERQMSLLDEHKQLEIKKNLMENQISNLEENVKFDSYQTKYNENQQWRNTAWDKTNYRGNKQAESKSLNELNWKRVTKQTDIALGMENYQ